ncbi:MarR family transcriptional regulator [Streptomyces sp. SID5785]|uniref:MarR family transcriptional regulator n=1 Tax=Streptomyces sp. SID5785 TaxID=2690309 RepID=UPI001360BF19|nr:MarR family transcriptional regulator [Streptomyces sp. SID5785]MZD04543.1 MarR family transcriptional regulator [Streptomyces sp. SID5785]
MNVDELFLLGLRLQKIAEAAIPTEGIGAHPTSTRSVLVVTADIKDNPGTTVTGIAKRTGLAQSQVSDAAARLRTAGAVVAEPDPKDGRRTLLRPNPKAAARVAAVRSASIAPALVAATSDPDEAMALLERLKALLKPLD